MNIYLIGFMAAGKSTIGPHLATALGWRFVDSDDELERSTGRTIESLIQHEGERAFRSYESDVLKKLSEGDQQVIAVGGGGPTIEANWDVFNRGISIYMKISPETLIQRLKHAKRPLLDGLDDAQRAARIRAMLEQRAPCYQRADIEIDAEGELKLIIKNIQRQVAACKL